MHWTSLVSIIEQLYIRWNGVRNVCPHYIKWNQRRLLSLLENCKCISSHTKHQQQQSVSYFHIRYRGESAYTREEVSPLLFHELYMGTPKMVIKFIFLERPSEFSDSPRKYSSFYMCHSCIIFYVRNPSCLSSIHPNISEALVLDAHLTHQIYRRVIHPSG